MNINQYYHFYSLSDRDYDNVYNIKNRKITESWLYSVNYTLFSCYLF